MAWEFKYAPDAQLQWRWLLIDDETGSIRRQSVGSFATLYQAVEDAKIYGHGAPSVPALDDRLSVRPRPERPTP